MADASNWPRTDLQRESGTGREGIEGSIKGSGDYDARPARQQGMHMNAGWNAPYGHAHEHPSMSMPGLVKDGAPRPDDSDEEDEAAGGDSQQGRYALHRSMPCGPGGTLRAQCAVCHCASTL